MKLKTSVVISTYNGELFITEQLESIRTQTVSVDEVIIYDDCSSDNTVRVVMDYIKKHGLENSWKINVNKKNKGWIQNFHDLLYAAQNDVIFLCDQDDIWFSDKVEQMLAVIEKNEEIKCLATSFKPYYMDENEIYLSEFYRMQMINDGTLKKMEISPKTVHLMAEGCTMCVKRAFLVEMKDFWFSGWAHDEFLWKTALCEKGMYKYNTATLYRRLHANNVSRQGMRSVEKRVRHLSMEYNSFKVMRSLLQGKVGNAANYELIDSLIEMCRLRIELIESKKIFNLVPLAFKYIKFYQNKKSYIAELIITLRSQRIVEQNGKIS